MILTCYLIDDEIHAINILKLFIEEVADLQLLGTSSSAVTALQEVNDLKPDIVFLDIDMPHLNGIEFLKLITVETKVVYTTALPDFALKAFEIEAFDYLLKPISFSRFQSSVNKLRSYYAKVNRANAINDYLYIKSETKGKMIRVPLDEILYVESNNNHITINLSKIKYTVYLPLKELESKLDPNKFVRIHKSFIVSCQKIDNIDGNLVVLTDKTVLQLGGTYKESFFRSIAPFIVKSFR